MTPAQIAHESGHATVAKHLGYKAWITNFDGKPRTDFYPPIWQMPAGLDPTGPAGAGVSEIPRKHRLLIWAAGRAALELMGSENPCDGFADDRNNMRALGCTEAEIECCVEEAKGIIKAEECRWRAVCHGLQRRDGLGEGQRLCRNEIDEIWDQA